LTNISLIILIISLVISIWGKKFAPPFIYNLSLFVISTIILNIYHASNLFTLFLIYIFIINTYLIILNLIPIPPFDITKLIKNNKIQKFYTKISKYEKFIFIVIFILSFEFIIKITFTLTNILIKVKL